MRVVVAILLILTLSSLLYLLAINSGVKVLVDLAPVKESQEYYVSLVILVALVTGVLFASVIGIVEGWRLRLHNHQLRNKIKRMETELRGLRASTMRAPEPDDPVDEESAL
jgi:uncharacterized integral membrane protein